MASRSLGSLTLDLTARVGGFERGMDKAARSADKRMREIERRAKIAGAAIGAALVGGTALVARAIGKTIDEFDKLSKSASKIGITTEALSRLEYAGRLSGVSIESLGQGVKRLGQFQLEAIRGSKEQSALFAKLGIDAGSASKGLRDADLVLRDLADVFARMPDGANKTALAVKLFGKAGSDLIPLLNQGSRGLAEFARKSDLVGYTLDTKTGKVAESFNDKIEELKLAIEGAWRQALPPLITKLDDMADTLNSADMRNGLAAVASGLATIANVAIQATAAVGNFFSRYSKALGNRGFLAASDGRTLEQLQARRDKLQKLLAPVDTSKAFDLTGATPARKLFLEVTGAREGITKELAEIDRLIKAYPFRGVSGRATGAWEMVSVPENLFDPAATGGRSKGSSKSDEARKLAEALREMARAEEEAMKASLEAERVRTRAMEDWAQITAELSGPLAVAELDHIRHLQDIARVGKEAGRSLAEIAEAQGQAKAAHQEATAALKQYQDALENPELVAALDQLRWQFSDLFSDLVDGSGSALDALKRFFDGVAQMITRSIADRWAEALFGKSGTTGSGTSGGNWFAGIFSALFGGGKASGGPVSAGRLYEVNEQGTELFSAGGRDYLLAGTDGSITPAHKLGGDGFTQQNVFHMAAPTDPRTQQQIAETIAFKGRQAARRNG